MPGSEHDLVTLAIIESRVEALCLADMLNAEGIAVHIGGYHHATVEVIPVALGGFRIWVPAVQYAQASALIRETGTHKIWTFSKSLQRAALKVLGFWLACYTPFFASSVAIGVLPNWFLAFGPLGVVSSVPVSPQGRGDYFLAPEEEI